MGAYDCDCIENILSERKNRLDNGSCSEKPNNSLLDKCPFCSKEARVRVTNHKVVKPTEGGRPYFSVTYTLGCFDCGVTFAYESKFEPNNAGTVTITQDGYSVAAAKWNRRGEK
jgi:uncharacterized Zn finger protein